ncbi:MAG: hypothetical protein N4J56_007108 [Chroococcidiopsis sp. SAG 2025]|nr:hypothetical protein [Chroococcidiopsis sp. SAG 2025]
MNKKIDTSNLLIKFFVFVIAYQLVSHWVTRETANTVSLQENNTMSKVVNGEMDNLSESYWSRYLCKKSNSHYIFTKPSYFLEFTR